MFGRLPLLMRDVSSEYMILDVSFQAPRLTRSRGLTGDGSALRADVLCPAMQTNHVPATGEPVAWSELPLDSPPQFPQATASALDATKGELHVAREDAIDRRKFLKQSARVAAGVGVLSAGSRPALRAQAEGPIGANERINIATIGCGGMGNGHLRALLRLREQGLVNIAAVCDVYEPRAQAAAEKTGGKAYGDYRNLLEDEDIDAVSIATPDHWHAPIAIDAADSGRDVYCEKPMTHWRKLSEAKGIVQAIARNGRVMQVGTQGMSDSIWEQAAARVEEGALGDLIHAQSSDMRNGYIGVYDPTRTDENIRPGENLDWDMWLGRAQKRPFEHGRFLSFRVFWDYSGGVCTDFFPHILTPLVRTMGLTFPRRAVSSGGLYHYADGRETPDIHHLVLEYPEGPSIHLLGGVANNNRIPTLIGGYEATLKFEGPGAIIEPQPPAKDKEREEITRERGGSLDEHFRDFLSCIKTRQKPRSHELLGYYVMTALHMGVRSYRNKGVYEFDFREERASRA
jgi:hypothetical protein